MILFIVAWIALGVVALMGFMFFHRVRHFELELMLMRGEFTQYKTAHANDMEKVRLALSGPKQDEPVSPKTIPWPERRAKLEAQHSGPKPGGKQNAG